MKKGRAGRQCGPKIVGWSLVQHHQSPAIVVAEKRRGPIGPSDEHQVIQKQFQFLLYVVGECFSVCSRQDQKVCVEVSRITMVVARLLEIYAVGFDVTRYLPQQNSLSRFSPARGSPKLREQRAEVKQRQRLARQMRVGTEIRRQVSLQMPRVQIKKLK